MSPIEIFNIQLASYIASYGAMWLPTYVHTYSCHSNVGTKTIQFSKLAMANQELNVTQLYTYKMYLRSIHH